ncbi:MAG: ribonuclease D [Acidiferrobacterales bacterium]
MDVNLVDTTAELEVCCAHLTQQPWIAVDTEFMREKTYYPQLCLVQIASAEKIYCIDKLAIDDTQKLQQVLASRDIIKIFHAARQDMEVLHWLCGMPPVPIFDSQIAAALLGYDDQLGYAALVEAITGTVLPKGYQRTDWTRRPLPEDQLKYAADDVRYLSKIYPVLFERLEDQDRLNWALEDCGYLTDPALYTVNPELAYLRIKQGGVLTPAQQHALQSLAAWRERVAQKKNRPRNWIARDGLLVYLAQSQPRNLNQLQQARGLSDTMREREGDAILEAIASAQSDTNPPLYDAVGPLTPTQTELRDLMMLHLKLKAEQLGIRPTVLSARREVDLIARGNESSRLLGGWRRQVIGEELLGLRQGFGQT